MAKRHDKPDGVVGGERLASTCTLSNIAHSFLFADTTADLCEPAAHIPNNSLLWLSLINDWRSPKYSLFRILKLTATLFYFNE